MVAAVWSRYPGCPIAVAWEHKRIAREEEVLVIVMVMVIVMMMLMVMTVTDSDVLHI